MPWQYQLNNKSRDLVKVLFVQFNSGDFTTADASRLMGCTDMRRYGSTMGALARRGVLERANGDKRCHYPTRTSGPTRWRFTKRFLVHYEKRYAAGVEE